MRKINELWRVAKSCYRTKFIGKIETTVVSFHVDEKSGEKFASWSATTDEHRFTISISEKVLKNAMEHWEKK